MRFVLQRMSLLAFGVLVSLVLLEIGLRIGGGVMRSVADRSVAADDQAGRLVLCVGDSHTYGTGVPPSQTYPSWLESDLQRVDPFAGYRVVNLGIPGMNSAQLVAELPAWLDEYEPDFVVVWVGLNNLWNRADPGGVGGATGRDLALQLLGGLKVVRLMTVLQTAEFLTEIEEKGSLDAAVVGARANSWLFGEQRTMEELYEVTMHEHALLADMLGARDIPWLILTYPRGMAEPVVQHRRAAVVVGKTLGVPVVNTAKALERARRKFPRAQMICTPYEAERKQCLLVNAMGPHPTGALYSMISKLVGEQVIETLGWSDEAQGVYQDASP